MTEYNRKGFERAEETVHNSSFQPTSLDCSSLHHTHSSLFSLVPIYPPVSWTSPLGRPSVPHTHCVLFPKPYSSPSYLSDCPPPCSHQIRNLSPPWPNPFLFPPTASPVSPRMVLALLTFTSCYCISSAPGTNFLNAYLIVLAPLYRMLQWLVLHLGSEQSTRA